LLFCGSLIGRIGTGKSHRLFTSDGFCYYAYLPSLILDGDLEFSNQFDAFPEERRDRLEEVTTATGHRANFFSVGPAFLWLPFFLLGHLAAWLSGHRGNGFGLLYELPTYGGSLAWAILGIFLAERAGRQLFPPALVRLAVLTVWLGTSAAAYTFCELHMAHGLSAMAVGLLLGLCLRADANPDQRRLWWALGGALGLTCLLRWQNVGLVLLPLMVLGRHLRAGLGWREGLLRGGGLLALAAVCFLPQLLTWRVIFGAWLTVPQGAGFLHWDRPQILAFLFSTNNGLFTWTPAVLVSFIGLAVGTRRAPAVCGAALGILALQAYVNSCVEDWWAGEAFGMRRMVDYAPFYVLGLAFLWDRVHQKSSRWPRGAALLAGAFIAWNLLLLIRYYLQDLPHGQPIPWDHFFLGQFTFPWRLWLTAGSGWL